VPILTAQELREVTVRDYMRSMGLARAEAEKLALSDLITVDNATRYGDIGAKPDKPRSKPAGKVVSLDDKPSPQPRQPQGQTVRVKALHSNPLMTGERWALAVGRIARILAGAGRSAILADAARNAEIPALAVDFADVWSDFQTRNPYRVGESKNRFDGMKDSDAAKKFIRLVEDICDRSSGRMGPWFVPK